MLSERAHFGAGGGEVGALASGSVAGALIGAVYLWPAAVSTRIQKRLHPATRILLLISGASLALTIVGVVANNSQVLSASTPIFVVSLAGSTAMVVGRLVRSVRRLISDSRL